MLQARRRSKIEKGRETLDWRRRGEGSKKVRLEYPYRSMNTGRGYYQIIWEAAEPKPPTQRVPTDREKGGGGGGDYLG
jgi:hypothetical protein